VSDDFAIGITFDSGGEVLHPAAYAVSWRPTAITEMLTGVRLPRLTVT
jgi:hypothetical protein